MRRQLMLIPSLACPAGCAYCFGSHDGGEVMRLETLEAVIEWQLALEPEATGDVVDIIFHGGEPLIAGPGFYRMALPLLREGLGPRQVRFGIQSNLWLLTDELAGLFSDQGVSLGTSLDGPEAINDAQRGSGYFSRTIAGLERARAHGLEVGVICTLTARSAPHVDEIFDFFLAAGLNFSLHAAVPSMLHQGIDHWSLTPQVHGELLVHLFDRYLENLSGVRISTFDSMVRSVSAGRGGLCTFGECLGGYLAIGPDGGIYPCQRFVGIEEHRLGDVMDRPALAELRASSAWGEFGARQETIDMLCGDCSYLPFCRGGCPYNALVAGQLRGRDPHCPAYRRIFAHMVDRALEEVFSRENLDEIVRQPHRERGLLRHGRLLSLMSEGSRGR